MKKLLPLLLTISCMRLAHFDPLRREYDVQRRAIAVLEVRCDGWVRWASGVVVSERHIITAAHTVRCSDIPDVHVHLYNGRYLRVAVTHDWAMYPDESPADVAKLELMSADRFELYIRPPELADGTESDASMIWCAATPSYHKCGEGSTAWRIFEHRSEFGDSGSGVYDSRGRLLGIVVKDINSTHTRIEPSAQKWLEGT